MTDVHIQGKDVPGIDHYIRYGMLFLCASLTIVRRRILP